jgi:hypothetical protein
MLELIRERYRGTLIIAGGFDHDTAEGWLQQGKADLIAFGRKFWPIQTCRNGFARAPPLTPTIRPLTMAAGLAFAKTGVNVARIASSFAWISSNRARACRSRQSDRCLHQDVIRHRQIGNAHLAPRSENASVRSPRLNAASLRKAALESFTHEKTVNTA